MRAARLLRALLVAYVLVQALAAFAGFQMGEPRVTAIDTNTVINVGTVIVLLTLAVTLTAKMTRVEEAVKPLADMPTRLVKMEGDVKHLGEDLGRLEGGVQMLEGDINNLWAAFRNDPPETMRREGRLPRKGPRGSGGVG